MGNKNEVFEYLIDQLRQQVTSNPYKQQCEGLAHEVQSLKNQLRDASALVAELQEDNIKKSDNISHLTGQLSAYRNDALRFQAQVGDLVKRQAKATGDESVQIKELTLALDSLDNEVMCLRSIVDLDPKGAIGYIRRANSAMTDTLRRQYLSKALEELGCKDESCWIEWSGGACPVPCGELVDVIYRDGGTLYGLPADKINDTERDASCSFWRHDGAPNDIVRYRKAVLQ